MSVKGTKVKPCLHLNPGLHAFHFQLEAYQLEREREREKERKRAGRRGREEGEKGGGRRERKEEGKEEQTKWKQHNIMC